MADIGIQVESRMPSKWQTKYPTLSPAIAPVKSMVTRLRDDSNLELEGRLGTVDRRTGRFKAGITRLQIDRILEMMQASPHVQGDEEWVEEQDFFFDVEQAQYRTRVSYNSEDMSLKTQTIEKSVIETRNIVVVASESDSDEARIDMRVSLKREKPVFNLQSCVNTTLVRIKQKRRFVTINGQWAFDFSMSWSGKNKTDAEQKQASVDPVFEVECELLDPERTLQVQNDDERVALSLIMKLCDLLPDPNIETMSLEMF